MAVQKRVSEFSMPGYQLKPRDRSKLNWSIKVHRGMVEKLNVILKDLKEHHSTLFQSNGLALKKGEKFGHSLNTVERSRTNNEVAGDRPNLFVKWRVRYIENLDITNLRENDQNVRYIKVIVND